LPTLSRQSAHTITTFLNISTHITNQVEAMLAMRHQAKERAAKTLSTAALAAFFAFAPLVHQASAQMPKYEKKEAVSVFEAQKAPASSQLGSKNIQKMPAREIACEVFATSQLCAIASYSKLPEWLKDNFAAEIDEIKGNPQLEKMALEEFRFYKFDPGSFSSLENLGKCQEKMRFWFEKTGWRYLPASNERQAILLKINGFLKSIGANAALSEEFFYNIGNLGNPYEVMQQTGLSVKHQKKLLSFLQQAGLSPLRPATPLLSPSLDIEALYSTKGRPVEEITLWRRIENFFLDSTAGKIITFFFFTFGGFSLMFPVYAAIKWLVHEAFAKIKEGSHPKQH
jgi:hypothetical protein